MDNREDSADFNDPISHRLAAIHARLDVIEAAVTLRNGRHRQRGGQTLRTMFAFGFGVVVGAGVAVLVRILS
jgi:tetrahydromethanopterin S-methyltransferase subunit G